MTSANELANYLSKLSLENSTRSTRSPPRSTRSSPRSTRSSPRSTRSSPRSTRSSPRSNHIGSLPENIIRNINGHDYGKLYRILDHARFMRAQRGLQLTPFRFNNNGPPYRIFYDPKFKTVYRNGNVW